MAEEIAMKVIARIHTDFPEKFGIPRQSGLIEELKSTIVFEPEFRDANALRGLEEYSHLWLIRSGRISGQRACSCRRSVKTQSR